MFASFNWYEILETEVYTNQLWKMFIDLYAQRSSIQPKLNRNFVHNKLIQSDKLFLTQTCGYDIANNYKKPIQLVLTPEYTGHGASKGFYSSYYVKLKGKPYKSLDEAIRDGFFVANDVRSFSGFYCVKEIDNLQTLWSGSHKASLEAIIKGQADWAAIDTISWAIFCHYYPDVVNHFEIFGQSEKAPAPPLVTAHVTSEEEVKNIKQVFFELSQDLQAKRILRKMNIKNFLEIPESIYVHYFKEAKAPGAQQEKSSCKEEAKASNSNTENSKSSISDNKVKKIA